MKNLFKLLLFKQYRFEYFLFENYKQSRGNRCLRSISETLLASSCFFFSIISAKHWADRGGKTTFVFIVKRIPNFPFGREIERINSAHVMKL